MRKPYIKLILSVILIFSLLITANVTAVSADEIISIDSIDNNYILVAENEELQLYADMLTGLFYLKQNSTGKLWYSTPIDSANDSISKGFTKTNVRSQIVVEYIARADESHAEATQVANSRSECINSGSVEVEQIKNGIRVVYNFETLGFVIPVTYTLNKEYLNAKVETDKIKEGKKNYLMNINLLPSFGAGGSSDEGKLFVPDGCGAIINFNNGINMKEQYNAYVYGDDLAQSIEEKSKVTETVRLPVFGTITQNASLMGLITEGQALSSITVINGNDRCGYNAVSSKLHLRRFASRIMFANNAKNKRLITRVSEVQKSEFSVRYYPLETNDTSINSLAECYRNYLIKECGLEKKNVTPSLNVDFYGSVDTTGFFLGIPYSKNTSLTTFSQAENIVKELAESGDFAVAARYIGWTGSGVTNKKMLKKASPMSSLGGKSELSDLNNYMKEQKFDFCLEADLIKSSAGKKSETVRTIFNRFAFQYDYLPSVFVTNQRYDSLRLITPSKINKYADKFLKSFEKLDDVDISLSTIGNTCYSDYNAENAATREEQAEICVEILKNVSKSKKSITLESANAYAATYANRILNTPINSSGYSLFDEDVPFYQMVFHGYTALSTPYVVQSSDEQNTFLKAVSTGSELLYSASQKPVEFLSGTRYDYLYGAEFDLWEKSAKEKMSAYSDLLKDVSNKKIVNYSCVSDGVYRTDFEEAISVFVNFNDFDVNIEGKNVPSLDFIVIRGDK